MTITLWIISCLLAYIIIGILSALGAYKWDGKSLDRLNTDDIMVPLIFWPFILLFIIGYGIWFGLKGTFKFLAVYVFRIPLTSTNPNNTGTQNQVSPTPEPPPLPKEEKKQEKKQEIETEVPRTALIDID